MHNQGLCIYGKKVKSYSHILCGGSENLDLGNFLYLFGYNIIRNKKFRRKSCKDFWKNYQFYDYLSDPIIFSTYESMKHFVIHIIAHNYQTQHRKKVQVLILSFLRIHLLNWRYREMMLQSLVATVSNLCAKLHSLRSKCK